MMMMNYLKKSQLLLKRQRKARLKKWKIGMMIMMKKKLNLKYKLKTISKNLIKISIKWYEKTRLSEGYLKFKDRKLEFWLSINKQKWWRYWGTIKCLNITWKIKELHRSILRAKKKRRTFENC